jgi:dipeptidase E
MRLFLASQDFGKHADKLREMVGDNKKSLVVFNARDLKKSDGEGFQRKLFAENGFEFRRLDLRDYFGKEKELEKFVAEYKPGLVVLLGGNTFLLRRALKQSGFDKILQSDIKEDKYVLAGHSAGSIVAGPSLRGYEMVYTEEMEKVPSGYQSEVVWDGLGFTGMRVIAHAGSLRYGEIIKKRQGFFDKNNDKYVVLDDDGVFVADGDDEEVLR